MPASSRRVRIKDSDDSRAPVLAPGELMCIHEWCALNKISLRGFYNLNARGEGPAITRLGRSVRISQESNARWQQQMTEVA
ncbi:MAG: hypothetical protein JO105_01635 [Hyphomicrobiales bacterium]|nr:hypothetical protein [Hyphomicrobiales bacterium]